MNEGRMHIVWIIDRLIIHVGIGKESVPVNIVLEIS
jgi:hypothetical protein